MPEATPSGVRRAAPIEVMGVAKRFGAHVALDGVTMGVAEGEVVVLLGANGAGKSTLLRVLAGMSVPDRGAARVAGHDVVAQRRSAVEATGFVGSTEHTWYLRLTALENLEFFAAISGIDRGRALPRVREALADVGLLGEAEKAVGAYSRGMRARLGLARAWLGSPEVLLLDEPTSGLDRAGAATFAEHLARRSHRAVLLSTHDPETAALADRALVLEHGRFAEELAGPPEPAVPAAALV